MKIGCYNDDMQIPKPLPVLLAKDITINAGQSIRAEDWKIFVKAFVCKCANETRKRGWYTFGIQSYGMLLAIVSLNVQGFSLEKSSDLISLVYCKN